MKCCSIRSLCPNFGIPLTPQQKAKRIQIALGIIALSGISLSLYAHISHLPSRVKYFGNFLTFSAFASWLILQVRSPNRSNIKKDEEANPSTLIPTSAERSHLPSPYSTVPAAIHLNIGKYVTPSDLFKLCQVSKKFSIIYSIDDIWKERFKEKQPAHEGQLCLQSIRAQENKGGLSQPASTETTNNNASISHSSWKQAYRLRDQIRHCKIEKMHIPENESGRARAFWMTHNKVCLAYQYNFEIWDAGLNHRLLHETVIELYKPKMKQIDNVVFYIGYQIANEQYDIYVYPFNVADIKAYKPMFFVQSHRNPLDFTSPIDLNFREAFIGYQDGVIGVWDLEKEERNLQWGDYFMFDDLSRWNDRQEQKWKETFKNEDVEEGERDRLIMERSREYQKVLDNRKFLNGHTQEITTLNLSGNCLFSSSKDGTIKQWDLTSYQCTRSFSSEFSGGARALWIEGASIFGESNYIFKQWELSSGNCLLTIDGKRPCAHFRIMENLLFCAYRKFPSKQLIIETYHLDTQCHLGSFSAKADHASSFNLDSMQIFNQCLTISTHDTLFTWNFSRKQDIKKLEEKKTKTEQPNFFRRVLNQYYRPFSH